MLRGYTGRVKLSLRSRKRVGIYSGTFDPIHNGHVSLAEAAVTQAGLDKLFFIVEPRPRRKQGVKAFEHRNEMVELAIHRKAKIGNIILEQQRFTIDDTLPILQARFKGAQLHMLIGDDALTHLGSWPHFKQLADSVKFIIGLRRGGKKQALTSIGYIQSTTGVKLRYQLIESPHAAAASTVVRRSLKRGQLPKDLDPTVVSYIKKHHLYSPDEVNSN